jgi:hypothetical protein
MRGPAVKEREREVSIKMFGRRKRKEQNRTGN